MRSFLLGAKTEVQDIPTAREYVQDGLVGMWDGIENAGWGTHNSSATVWKDLIGTVDATINGEWTSNSIKRSTAALNVEAATIVGRWQTWCYEVVFRLGGEVVSLPYNVVKIGRYGSIYVPLDTMRLNEATQTNDFDLTLEYNKTYSISDMLGTIYSNSAKINPTTNPRAYYTGETDAQRFLLNTSGEIFCIRRYSRALTAQEVAANYAVDKRRFGL